MNRQPGDYAVGYGRPPKSTRFQPGQSGNPKGRPKGVVNLATALDAALNERVIIKENGKARSLTKLEVLIKQAVNKAAAGDHRATQFITQLLTQNPSGPAETTSPEEIKDQDQAILAQLRARMQRAARTDLREALNPEPPHAE